MAPALGQRLHDLVGTWARPADTTAKVAAALALAALLIAAFGRGRSLLGMGPFPVPRKLFLWIAAFSAALLSILYIAIYLRGGPRIIDATTYFLQGRALSHGDFAWSVAEPTASFRGRFLLFHGGAGGDGTMGGIFPPGYPLLLSLGFVVGAPMVVGPAIAAALVLATYRLALTIAEDALSPYGRGDRELVEPIARTAALLSVVCGALRYHTADTMSHGATALGIALALDAALRKRAVIAGLVLGAVVATRPISALGIGIVVVFVLLRDPKASTKSILMQVAGGLLPGVFLLALAQHAVTGSWLTSSQRMYYALSDGPRGCFRWGFGKAGCLYEHGDFVKSRLANGYGVVEALGTTLRRLRVHLLDIANLEPLALLVLVPLWRARGRATSKRSLAVVASLAAVGLHVLAHLPFYFDGNYPGGGARFFADVLPIEHALLALAIARLAAPRYGRASYALLGAALAGFAVHASYEHTKLAERDGGRPMFEPDLLARANINSALVFVDTDHAFALGHDPSARIKNNVVVARLRNDDRDRILYDRLDHPTTYLYKFELAAIPPPLAAGAPVVPPAPAIVPWAPPALGETLRFEAEAEWPVLAQQGGFAIPAFTEACASGGRALVLVPQPLEGKATATLSIPVPQAGRYSVALRAVQGTKVPNVTTRASAVPSAVVQFGGATWSWADVEGGACADLNAREVNLTPPSATLVMEVQGGAATLDRVTLKRIP